MGFRDQEARVAFNSVRVWAGLYGRARMPRETVDALYLVVQSLLQLRLQTALHTGSHKKKKTESGSGV